MKKLTRYFFEGLLFLVPIVATFYVLYVVFIKIDRIFQFKIPGMGFAVTIITVTVIGFIASHFLTRRLIRTAEKTLGRLPLVRMIYTSIKDLTGAFVGEKKSFNRPVLVSLSPGDSVQVIGFVTREELDTLGLAGKVAVYLPQSYNFAGNLIIVPKEQVIPLQAESGNVMAFIVSGGITAH
jgi:uncharacterized membrane protein